MLQPYNPPTQQIAANEKPELQPIFNFLNIHSQKLYNEGYFLKLVDFMAGTGYRFVCRLTEVLINWCNRWQTWPGSIMEGVFWAVARQYSLSVGRGGVGRRRTHRRGSGPDILESYGRFNQNGGVST